MRPDVKQPDFGIKRCVSCGCTPSARDQARIDADLSRYRVLTPVAWYCPGCAPELDRCPSGLAWDVLDARSR